MKAREKGTNDPFREVQSINLNGEFYPPEVLEFEEEQVCAKNAHTANDGKIYMSEAFVRNQAAIAAMQGIMNFFGSIDYNKETIAKLAVQQANALIAELKKGE